MLNVQMTYKTFKSNSHRTQDHLHAVKCRRASSRYSFTDVSTSCMTLWSHNNKMNYVWLSMSYFLLFYIYSICYKPTHLELCLTHIKLIQQIAWRILLVSGEGVCMWKNLHRNVLRGLCVVFPQLRATPLWQSIHSDHALCLTCANEVIEVTMWWTYMFMWVAAPCLKVPSIDKFWVQWGGPC